MILILLGLAALPLQHDPAKTRVFKQAAEMDYGPVIAATVGVAKDHVVAKGLVIRVSRDPEAYVLFDTELLRVAAAWTGGWLHLAGRAYADDSNDFPWVKGELAFTTARAPGWAKDGSFQDPRPAPGDGPLPRDWAKFRGHSLHGERAVVAYTVGDALVHETFGYRDGTFTRTIRLPALRAEARVRLAVSAEGPGVHDGHAVHAFPVQDRPQELEIAIKAGGAVAHVRPVETEAIPDLLRGGPSRWTAEIVTAGQLGKGEGPYAVDTLTAPEQNPYRSWLRFTGVDFFPDGRAALSTWSGDVWIVSGIDATLGRLRWKRFAAGIGQPMGLKIVDGKILVAARDQVTRLHDLNDDGEADFYECFNNDLKLTTNFHEFVFDLETDLDGNFYCAKGSAIWAGSLRMTDHSGTFCRISKDGTRLDILADGLRAPNGVGVGPDGLLTCSDNQGNWVPLCPINAIRPGAHYGFAGQGQKPRDRERPVCWIPMSADKSTGSQIWVPDDRWGPLRGRMVAASYDCSVSLVLLERIPDGLQGGVVRFPFTFPSGVMRGRFHPGDGQLYLAGLRGWSSRAARDCSFSRVRWTGKPVRLPASVTTRKDGLDVAFTDPLDPASVADPDAIGALQFNVVRTGGYGSSEYSVQNPKKTGRDPVEIAGAKLSADGRTVSLEIPGLRPVTNLVLKFRVKAADGSPVSVEIDYTLHHVPP